MTGFGLLLDYPDLCTEGVTRRDEFQPCDKPAVAVRLDPEEGNPYPVCAYHTRGDMVTLPDLIAATADTPGLVEVLRKHHRGAWECACGGCHLYDGEPEKRRDKHATHLEAVVRAWLRGTS